MADTPQNGNSVATWRGVGGEEDGEEKGKKGEKDKGKRG